MTLHIGPVGVVIGQSVDLTAVNAGSANTKVSLTLLDASSKILVTKSLTLSQNQSGVIEYQKKAGIDPGFVRGQMKTQGASVYVGLEVFDTKSGRPSIIAGAGPGNQQHGINIEYTPAAGITKGLTARVGATNLGTADQTLTVSFFDVFGVVLQSTQLTVAPGQTGFGDLNGDSFATRATFAAVVTLANVTDKWQVSEEMVDNTTGTVLWLAEPSPDPFL